VRYGRLRDATHNLPVDDVDVYHADASVTAADADDPDSDAFEGDLVLHKPLLAAGGEDEVARFAEVLMCGSDWSLRNGAVGGAYGEAHLVDGSEKSQRFLASQRGGVGDRWHQHRARVDRQRLSQQVPVDMVAELWG